MWSTMTIRRVAALIALLSWCSLTSLVSPALAASAPLPSPGLFPPTSPNASPHSFKTPEYYAGGGLDIINAAEAYARGFTGKGITLGILDTPLRTDHPELAGKAESVLPVMENGQIYVPDWTLNVHGSHVGGIMAAMRNGQGMHGVAFDARLLGWAKFMGEISLPAGDETFNLYASRSDVRIINNSWSLEL